MNQTEEGFRYLDGKWGHDLTADQKFRILTRKLRKRFPPEYPVKMRRLDLGEDKKAPSGYCQLANEGKARGKRYFTIIVNKRRTWSMQFDTILHEWAHALTWENPTSQDHSRYWAEAYGKLYRAMVED